MVRGRARRAVLARSARRDPGRSGSPGSTTEARLARGDVGVAGPLLADEVTLTPLVTLSRRAGRPAPAAAQRATSTRGCPAGSEGRWSAVGPRRRAGGTMTGREAAEPRSAVGVVRHCHERAVGTRDKRRSPEQDAGGSGPGGSRGGGRNVWRIDGLGEHPVVLLPGHIATPKPRDAGTRLVRRLDGAVREITHDRPMVLNTATSSVPWARGPAQSKTPQWTSSCAAGSAPRGGRRPDGRANRLADLVTLVPG
jgi:hypothetical protein